MNASQFFSAHESVNNGVGPLGNGQGVYYQYQGDVMPYPSSSHQQLSLNSQCGGKKRKKQKKHTKRKRMRGGGLIHPGYELGKLYNAMTGHAPPPNPHPWNQDQIRPDPIAYNAEYTEPLAQDGGNN